MLFGFIKGVSGGCFILIINDITYNPPLPTIHLYPQSGSDDQFNHTYYITAISCKWVAVI